MEQECPGGLLFSVKGYCDYAANVHCGDRSVTQKSKLLFILNFIFNTKNIWKFLSIRTFFQLQANLYRQSAPWIMELLETKRNVTHITPVFLIRL